jgi:hypothetical protein
VVDVRILKTANNLDDRIHFTDVAEKLIAEPLSLAGTLHKSRNVDKFDGGRNDLLRFRKRG